MSTKQERRKKPRVEHFLTSGEKECIKPVWFFSDEDESLTLSLIINSSDTGAAILLPKAAFVASKRLRLNTLYADQGKPVSLNQTADIKWADHAYSIDHVLLGIEFTSSGDRSVIRAMISESTAANPLRCTIDFDQPET